jgi:hypothetical protein
MWSLILDVKNVMALAPNTLSLPRPKEKSSILESYSTNEVWKFAANAIQEGLAFRMEHLNTHGMTKTTNLIKQENPCPSITNLSLESGETHKPTLNPIINNGSIFKRVAISMRGFSVSIVTIPMEGPVDPN